MRSHVSILVSLKRGLQDLAGLFDNFGLPLRHLAAEARSNLSHYCAIYRDHEVPP
jgi:hypothetical protein